MNRNKHFSKTRVGIILLSLLMLNNSVTVSTVNAMIDPSVYDYSDSSDEYDYRRENERRRQFVSNMRRREMPEFPLIVRSDRGDIRIHSANELRRLEHMVRRGGSMVLDIVTDSSDSEDMSAARADLSRQVDNLTGKKEYRTAKTALLRRQGAILDANVNRSRETTGAKIKRTTTDKFIDTASTIAVAATVAILGRALDPFKKLFTNGSESD